MSSRGYQITKILIQLNPHILDKRSTDPPAEEARIYYNTVIKRPKIYIEE